MQGARWQYTLGAWILEFGRAQLSLLYLPHLPQESAALHSLGAVLRGHVVPLSMPEVPSSNFGGTRGTFDVPGRAIGEPGEHIWAIAPGLVPMTLRSSKSWLPLFQCDLLAGEKWLCVISGHSHFEVVGQLLATIQRTMTKEIADLTPAKVDLDLHCWDLPFWAWVHVWDETF